jgi:molybdenum cofactor biosynthesis protein B
MSVAEHRAASPSQVACFVLTVSDSRTLETEGSGRAIADLLVEAGHTVVDRQLLPDDPDRVRQLVRDVAARGDARTIITTGGTGIARRDSTYEALTGLFEKTLFGFGELFRMLSFEEIGPAAMLSRATAGVVRGTVVFVLPGSPHAVRLAMTRLILPELGHIVRELTR